MHVARLYDGADPTTGPYIDADHPRIADRAECERIAAFLNAGTAVMRTTAKDVDRIDANRGRVVPLVFRTDGQWVWPDALAYYVANHGISPEPELVAHIVAAGYQPVVPDEDGRRLAADAVRPAAR